MRRDSQESFLDRENRERGERRRDSGTSRVKANNKNFVEQMRIWAEGHASRYGRVTAADVRGHANRIGVEPEHPNAWGSVFKDKRFVQLGTEISSTPSRNAGIIRIWGLAK